MKISYDLHIHSCLSPCGDMEMTPNNIVNMAVLLGLDCIAVSDHNAAFNLPAVFSLAKERNLLTIPAIEACTSEEVHVLCFTETLETMLAFSEALYAYLPDFKNREDIFGEQLVMDAEDLPVRKEEKLLINALTLDIEGLIELLNGFDGIAVPAHVDKNANSIISNLGLIPPEYGFCTAEVRNPAAEIAFEGLRITDSDAHSLDQMQEPAHFLDVKEKSVRGILDRLKGR